MENQTTNRSEFTWKSAGNVKIDSAVLMILPLVIFIFLTDLLTCIALSQTKRIPFPTMFLTCFTLGCDCMFSLVLISTVVPLLADPGLVYIAICTEIGRIAAALSWISVTLMLAERVLCFRYPNRYAQHAQNRNVVIITLVIMSVIIVAKVTLRYVILPQTRGEAFDFVAQTRDEQLLTWILGICLAFGITCYLVIIDIIKRHVRLIADIRHSSRCTRPLRVLRLYKSTKSVIIIFAVFLCIHVPLFLCLVLNNAISQNKTVLRFAVLIAMFAISIVNPFLYGWRFKECRYTMVHNLARACRVFEDRAERMRFDVYNIVAAEGNSISVIKTVPNSVNHDIQADIAALDTTV